MRQQRDRHMIGIERRRNTVAALVTQHRPEQLLTLRHRQGGEAIGTMLVGQQIQRRELRAPCR